ncbi:hypothetical protein J1614_000697 [Plenodomus biglobosus]|nr:hypothetical protein J1614_000697 [Plenodomus biglobosus]
MPCHDLDNLVGLQATQMASAVRTSEGPRRGEGLYVDLMVEIAKIGTDGYEPNCTTNMAWQVLEDDSTIKETSVRWT